MKLREYAKFSTVLLASLILLSEPLMAQQRGGNTGTPPAGGQANADQSRRPGGMMDMMANRDQLHSEMMERQRDMQQMMDQVEQSTRMQERMELMAENMGMMQSQMRQMQQMMEMEDSAQMQQERMAEMLQQMRQMSTQMQQMQMEMQHPQRP